MWRCEDDNIPYDYPQEIPGVEIFLGQAQAQGFLNLFNPSPVSDLSSPNLYDKCGNFL